MKILFAENVPLRKMELDYSISEDEFYNFCQQNPDLNLERDAQGNILIEAPTFPDGGLHESRAIIELGKWNDAGQLGEVFSSQAGFTLANGAVRCPDASWISKEKLASLPAHEMERFAHVCPDFVIEIRSKSDSLSALKAKMDEYIQNGAQLGFLIDPNELTAYLYRADGSVEKMAGMEAILTGGNVLPGFSLPLAKFAR